MAHTIRDVMTSQPMVLESNAAVTDAARAMRDKGIGTVVVRQNGAISGIVTDRDIVVRTVAEGKDCAGTSLGDICSHDLTTIGPDASTSEAVQIMRSKALRRIPVVDGSEVLGIVSIGDLAIELDNHSALADISAAAPNN